jgi:nucleoside 2-deoxyribosyltransferase
MQHAVDDDGFDPRLRHLLSSVIKVLESNNISVFSAHMAENFGGHDASGQAGAVAQRDFRWMLECDVYLAVLPAGTDNASYRSDGTYVELGWASALGKPILLATSSSVDHSLLVQGLGSIGRVWIVNLEDIQLSPERIIPVVRVAGVQ